LPDNFEIRAAKKESVTIDGLPLPSDALRKKARFTHKLVKKGHITLLVIFPGRLGNVTTVLVKVTDTMLVNS